MEAIKVTLEEKKMVDRVLGLPLIGCFMIAMSQGDKPGHLWGSLFLLNKFRDTDEIAMAAAVAATKGKEPSYAIINVVLGMIKGLLVSLDEKEKGEFVSTISIMAEKYKKSKDGEKDNVDPGTQAQASTKIEERDQGIRDRGSGDNSPQPQERGEEVPQPDQGTG